MKEAMGILGIIKEELDTKKTREDFPSDDFRKTELNFKYYQKRLLETINSLLLERRKMRIKAPE